MERRWTLKDGSAVLSGHAVHLSGGARDGDYEETLVLEEKGKKALTLRTNLPKAILARQVVNDIRRWRIKRKFWKAVKRGEGVFEEASGTGLYMMRDGEHTIHSIGDSNDFQIATTVDPWGRPATMETDTASGGHSIHNGYGRIDYDEHGKETVRVMLAP